MRASPGPGFLLCAMISCAREPARPTLESILDDFVDEVGLEFPICGGGDEQIECGGGVEGSPDGAFQAASACFLDSLSACRPARVQLTWGWGPMWYGQYENELVRNMFVVPNAEGGAETSCKLVVFESDRVFRASQVSRHECEGLLEAGTCAAIEPDMCVLVETIDTDQEFSR